MITLIIEKEILEKQISQKFSKECNTRLEAFIWKIYYTKKGYEVGELKDGKIHRTNGNR